MVVRFTICVSIYVYLAGFLTVQGNSTASFITDIYVGFRGFSVIFVVSLRHN